MPRLDKVKFAGSDKTGYQFVNDEGIVIDLYDDAGERMLPDQIKGKTWTFISNVAKDITPNGIKAAINQHTDLPGNAEPGPSSPTAQAQPAKTSTPPTTLSTPPPSGSKNPPPGNVKK